MFEMKYFDNMIRVCPICGNTFVCRNADDWVYKRGRMIACSWHCLRKYDALPEKEQKAIVKSIPKDERKVHTKCVTE